MDAIELYRLTILSEMLAKRQSALSYERRVEAIKAEIAALQAKQK